MKHILHLKTQRTGRDSLMPPVGRTLVVLALTVLVAFATFAGAQPPGYAPPLEGSSLIIPGYAIGSYSLDLRVAALYWQYGMSRLYLSGVGPQFRPGIEERLWWDLPVVVVTTSGENSIVALGSSSGYNATRQNIGPGSEEAKVTSTYGKPSAIVLIPSRPKVLIYDNLGVAFEIAYNIAEGGWGAVDSVYVFRPGQAAMIWRTP